VGERFGPTSEDFSDDFVWQGSGEDTEKAVSSSDTVERVGNLLPAFARTQETGVPLTPHIASPTLRKFPVPFRDEILKKVSSAQACLKQVRVTKVLPE
jgi:hypothetical protein